MFHVKRVDVRRPSLATSATHQCASRPSRRGCPRFFVDVSVGRLTPPRRQRKPLQSGQKRVQVADQPATWQIPVTSMRSRRPRCDAFRVSPRLSQVFGTKSHQPRLLHPTTPVHERRPRSQGDAVAVDVTARRLQTCGTIPVARDALRVAIALTDVPSAPEPRRHVSRETYRGELDSPSPVQVAGGVGPRQVRRRRVTGCAAEDTRRSRPVSCEAFLVQRFELLDACRRLGEEAIQDSHRGLIKSAWRSEFVHARATLS